LPDTAGHRPGLHPDEVENLIARYHGEQMRCYVLKNKSGEFFSPRTGRCSPDFSPFSHLFRDLKKATWNKNFYDTTTLHIEEVEVQVVSSKKI
jgi:hypothetical protein